MQSAQGHADPKTATTVDLEALVAEADMGGRRPTGSEASFLFCVGVAWSLFQLWYASPLAFSLGFGVFNDTEARAIHLAFALLLAFAGYPALKSSPRNRVPLFDWLLAAAGIGAVLYLIVFYNDLAMRPGLPTRADIIVAVIGELVLIEASRRAEAPWMPLFTLSFLAYVFTGPWLPGPACAQRCIARPRRFAFLVNLGRGLRRGARGIDDLHFPIRPVRRPPREGWSR